MRLLVLAFLPALLAAGEPAVDPSNDEMAVLMQANRHRTDRVTSDNRICEMLKSKRMVAILQSWFQVGGRSAALPPLVHNPALTAAARKLLQDGAKPPDNAPFDATPAAQAAGYVASKDLITMFGLDAPDLPAAYVSALLNVVGTKQSNNQTLLILTAQGAMSAAYREVGIAVNFAKGHANVVLLLGKGTAKRYLGGVVYTDSNHNLAYEPGEGKGGVQVSYGGVSMTTGASGAWWLAVDSDAAGELAFSGGGFTTKRPVAKGAATTTVDWRMPDPADQKAADRLIADAEKVAANPDLEKKRVPLAALLCGTRMAALDDARQQQIDGLIAPLLGDYDSAVAKVLVSLAEEPAEAKKKLADLRRDWKGAMPAWFKEAENLAKLRQQVVSALSATKDQARLAAPALKQVQKAASETVEPKFLHQYVVWEEQLGDVMPAAAPKTK